MVDVKNLRVYKDKSEGIYRGICKKFFPKWPGWPLLLEEEVNEAELDNLVEHFYLEYFYYEMKLDELKNKTIAFMLLNFATQHGKKKTLSKFYQVSESIESFNSLGKLGEYHLLLELMEFYSYIGRLEDANYISDTYRKL